MMGHKRAHSKDFCFLPVNLFRETQFHLLEGPVCSTLILVIISYCFLPLIQEMLGFYGKGGTWLPGIH